MPWRERGRVTKEAKRADLGLASGQRARWGGGSGRARHGARHRVTTFLPTTTWPAPACRPGQPNQWAQRLPRPVPRVLCNCVRIVACLGSSRCGRRPRRGHRLLCGRERRGLAGLTYPAGCSVFAVGPCSGGVFRVGLGVAPCSLGFVRAAQRRLAW